MFTIFFKVWHSASYVITDKLKSDLNKLQTQCMMNVNVIENFNQPSVYTSLLRKQFFSQCVTKLQSSMQQQK